MMISKIVDGNGNFLTGVRWQVGPNPTDRGKIGTKRHVLTDQRGIPVSVVITAANTHDMKAVTETLDRTVVKRPLKEQNLCLDKGYDMIIQK